MRPVVRGIASVIVPLSILGCDGFLGIGDDALDVAVIAEVRPAENVIVYAIENRSPETVYLTWIELERREGDEWRWVDEDKLFTAIRWVEWIGPGEDYVGERHGVDLPPGNYRYRMKLYEDVSLDRPMPRISNTVRIE